MKNGQTCQKIRNPTIIINSIDVTNEIM